MPEVLNEEEVAARLRRLPWEREGDEIVREWRFEDFNEAVAFVNRVAEVAEEANHHPDILLHGWNKVKLSLTNHSAGGLTEVDFTMAERFDAPRRVAHRRCGVRRTPSKPRPRRSRRGLLLPLGVSLNERRRTTSK